jgi:transcriptional regulator with XRE-family HTH domain
MTISSATEPSAPAPEPAAPDPEAGPSADLPELDRRLAERLLRLRSQRNWTLDDLAQRSGVSRATLSRLERGETSPTASLLNRLCHAHGLSLSRLLAEIEARPVRRLALAEQATWRDPETGYQRRMVSPPSTGFAAELVAAELPAGARVAYDQPAVAGLEHHVLLLDGRLDLTVDGECHPLQPGDSLRFRLWGPNAFEAPGPSAARYLIAVCQPT